MPTPSSVSYKERREVYAPAETYNKRIVIQVLVQTPDGIGGFTGSWQDYVKTWAHVEPWKGQERFLQDQMYPTLWVRILMRYRPSQNITATHRVLYRGRNFNIRSVRVLSEAQTVIELLAEELQAQGSTA